MKNVTCSPLAGLKGWPRVRWTLDAESLGGEQRRVHVGARCEGGERLHAGGGHGLDRDAVRVIMPLGDDKLFTFAICGPPGRNHLTMTANLMFAGLGDEFVLSVPGTSRGGENTNGAG